MVGANFEQDSAMAIPMNIWKLEKAIGELPWYRFIKKWKMQDELAEMRAIGARVGFVKAMKDLENLGIVKRVN